MSYSAEFDPGSYPPFPNDLPTAPLVKISLEKLVQDVDSERDLLFEACRHIGFFYLDLHNTFLGKTLENSSEELGRLAEKTFLSLSQSEKDRYAYCSATLSS